MKMMKKKGKIATLALAAVSTLAVSFWVMEPKGKASADEYVLLPATEIKAEYAVESTFSVPSASFEKDGQQYAADSVYLVFPDNQAKYGDEFTLSQIGQYNLVYSATINGETVVSEKSFVAAESLYAFENEASTVAYQDELLMSKGTRSGVKVNLVSGDTFTYNKPINLNTLGENSILRFHPYNWTALTGDEKSLENQYYYIRLTDCYDSTNYMNIKFRWYSTTKNGKPDTNMYLQASMSNQTNVGLEIGNPNPSAIKYTESEKHVYIDGQGYKAYYDVRYGTIMSKSGDGEGYQLYFDTKTNQLYGINPSGAKNLVTDFDNADIYGTKLYKGFTTGEVYLSITASGFLNGATAANFEISEIGGGQLENKDFYVDENAPVTSIDKYRGDIVKIAKNQPFEVFGANYTDINGVKSTKVSAYYGYGTKNATEVSIVDGKFTPTREGLYTLVYTATDSFGKTSTTLAKVYSVSCEGGKAVQFSVEKLASVGAGAAVALPQPTISSINNGEFYKAYYVHKASGEITEIDGESFVPARLGAHEMVYVYGDDYLQYTYSYDFTVSSSNNVVFGDMIAPSYLIKGYKYTLEDVIATTFAGSQEEYASAEVYAKADGGEYSSTPIDAKGYEVTANTSVRFKFVKNGASIESEEIPVIDVFEGESLAAEKYFAGDFTKSAHETKGVMLRANATSGDSSVDFINDITFSNFEFAFDIPQEAANFNGVKLTLTDYYDRSNVKEIILEKNGSGVRLSSGEAYVEYAKAFEGGNFRLKYSLGQIMEGENAIPFANEFTFERVLLTVTLLDIQGTAGLDVGGINGQSFSNITSDDFAPSVLFNNPNTGYVKMGDKATIHKAFGADVLSPYYMANLRVSVKDPNGKFVTAIDGTLLSGDSLANKDYEIELTAYGRYSITYSYEDQSGNVGTAIDFYNVVDDVAPTLTLFGVSAGEKITASLYQPIEIAAYEAKDNVSKATQIKTYVIIYAPTHENVHLKDTTSFTVDKQGVWTVKYVCVDMAGNYSFTEYYVEVE